MKKIGEGFSVNEDVLLGWVNNDILAAETYYRMYLETQLIQRFQRLTGDPRYYGQLFPNLQERCKVMTSDVADTIEWILPDLMETFWGGPNIITIVGQTPDIDGKPMQDLVNWQYRTKQNGFLTDYRMFKEALWAGFSWCKGRWIRERRDIARVSQVSGDTLLAMKKSSEVNLLGAKEVEDGVFQVHYKANRLHNNYCRVENIPLSEVIWNPDCDYPSDHPPFICHRRQMTFSEIEQRIRQGVFTNITEPEINEAIAMRTSLDSLDNTLRPYIEANRATSASGDKARNRALVYECYAMYDVNEDGQLEDCLVTRIGNRIVQAQLLDHDTQFFAQVRPYPDNYSMMGRSIDDMIGDLQDVKTALFRQMILSNANNMDRPVVYDEEALNREDMEQRRRFVRWKDESGGRKSIRDAWQFAPESPMASDIFPFVEYIDQLAEKKTGINRQFQGMDPHSFNKTATGAALMTGATNRRVKMIARMFAETGKRDQFRMMVRMNQQYYDEPMTIRVAGKAIAIHPENLIGDFDYEVSPTLGIGDQDAEIRNLHDLIGMNAKIMMPGGIVTPENMYNVYADLITAIGKKDLDRYATKPMMQNPMSPNGGAPGQEAPGQPPAEFPGVPEGIPPGMIKKAIAAGAGNAI